MRNNNNRNEQKKNNVKNSGAAPSQRQKINFNDERYILYRKLPFTSRKLTLIEWVEKNSTTVLVTSLIVIGSFLALASWKIDLIIAQLTDGVLIEIPQVEEPKIAETIEEKRQNNDELERMLQNIKNEVSDANAKYDAGLKSDKNSDLNDVEKEAQEIQDRLDANKASYEKGMQEIENMGAGGNSSGKGVAAGAQSSQNDKKGEGNKDNVNNRVRKKGNVTVEYDLPGRHDTYLSIPAYKCEDGGRVVINITVDRNGDVIDASVKSSTATSRVCIVESALDAARNSRFDVNGGAAMKQSGTITYLFLAQ